VLKATLHWLFGPRHVWACLLVTAVALIFCLRPGTSEPVIRLTGLALQLLGVLTVAWGIAETRRFFGLPPLRSKVKAWLEAAPFRRSQTVSAVGHATLGAPTGKARGYGMHGPGENPTVESRLEALEKNLAVVHQRITGLEQEYDQELRSLSERIRAENGSLKAELGQVRGRLEGFGTGGVRVSAMGVVWLFLGLVLSTAGVEIAEWLR